MFLESCGKVAFSRIRSSFFYFLLLLPILLIGGYLFTQLANLQILEDRFADAAKKGKTAVERKMRAEHFIKRYSNADPYFLDRQIESLSFLQKEREQIESLLNHPALSQKQTLQDRLRFLAGDRNRLTFAEENIRSSPQIKETEEKQRHPVQMDGSDLARLCALIEDIPVGSFRPLPRMPQLLFLDFRMKKIQTPFHSEIYELEAELLKREWTN